MRLCSIVPQFKRKTAQNESCRVLGLSLNSRRFEEPEGFFEGIPDGVIGNTADFDSAIPGSNPGRVIADSRTKKEAPRHQVAGGLFR